MANILVVDDELGIRDLLSEILNDEGHSVDLAENATQARSARLAGTYDLVLLDLMLPGMPGTEVCRVIRTTANTPIISVSISRNAAMYSPTRLSIEWLARTQIGIRNTESMISISAMPSIPSAQLNPANSGTFSTNCHCAPPIS